MIDLRSDTCSRPTDEMRKVMAAAPVGDDVYGDDPTVRALEHRTAELLGKEEAVYMPSGTMTNQVALRTHTEAGDEVLMEADAHLYLLESGAPAALSGLMIRHIKGRHGIFTERQVDDAMRVEHPFQPTTSSPPTRLLCVENTHNLAGGTVWPIERIREVAGSARRHGLALHLDGARLWNACVRAGVPAAQYADHFDSVSVCFSKGLGAPVGSALAGRSEFVSRARRFKRMFGGGFRQAGIIAAGALHALEHHRELLARDHDNAADLANGLARLPGIEIDLETVQTNIVRFGVTSMTAGQFVEECMREGLSMLPSGRDQVRAVLYLNVTAPDIQRALEIVRSVVNGRK